LLNAKRQIAETLKGLSLLIALKMRRANVERLTFALSAVICLAAYIYFFARSGFEVRLVILFSSAIGAVLYYLLFAARVSIYLLGFDPASPPKRRFSRGLKAIAYVTRAIVATCAVFVFGAALMIASAIAAVFGAEKGLAAEALYAAAIGASLGAGAFLCVVYAFRKPRSKNGALRAERR
jgi:hypothetical protein